MTLWLSNLLGAWGAPGDAVAWTTLGLGVLVVGLALVKKERIVLVPEVSERTWVWLCAFVAAFLSLGYVAFYLHGGPRIIDATAYMWQARALAAGHFGEHVPLPSESFRGRFLLYDPDSGTLTGLFPPGYPLLLSLGVRLGAPMVVGPLLAFALIFATARLAREMGERTTLPAAARADLVRVATLAQVLCATMRYHTADTMSHGLAALLVTVALSFSLSATGVRERAGRARWHAMIAGLAIAALAATRLASAPPMLLVVTVLLVRGGKRRALVPLALGLVPGLALLLASQSAATGSAWMSAQKLYYARSDGPASCFRYGFGRDVGCVFEHGDFVRARLHDGYGLVSALGVTLRRLRSHLTDVQNLEPLALVALVVTRTTRRAAVVGLGVLLSFVLAYAPFYFDGNYPGGGGRFLADVLPVSHVLLALGAFALAERAKHVSYTRVAVALLGAGLVGFAVHASFDHRLLASRDGGRPMYERDVVATAGVTNGLVFVDTDHGFLLGHDPPQSPDPTEDAKRHVVVARLREDASDRLLYEAVGAPPTWRYERGEGEVAPRLVPFNVPQPRVSGMTGYRFESENEWPGLSAAWNPDTDGHAFPAWASGGCASNGRVLRVTPARNGEAHVSISLPVPASGPLWLSPRIRGSGTDGRMKVHVEGESGPVELELADPPADTCVDLPPRQVVLARAAAGRGAAIPKEARVDVTVVGRMPMDLDALTLRP